MNVNNRLLSLLIVAALLMLTGIIGCEVETEREELPDTLLDHSLLVFSKTDGWRHDSIEAGVDAVMALGEENGVFVFATEDAGYFNESDLDRFDAVLFLNTTETVFNAEQREAFQAYIQNGGGFAGVHSAADTEYDWPWYGEFVGAYFESHPSDPNVRNAEIIVENPNHISTHMLPNPWEREDEWYNFQEIPDHVEVLLRLDTDSYEGSEHPNNHPIAWFHDYDGGRAFYTGLGHTIESYSEQHFLDHLWGGLEYAMDIEPTF